MNVARDDEWWVQLDQVRLRDEDLLRFLDQHFYLFLLQIHGLDPEVGSISSDVLSHLKKLVDNGI